MGKQSNKQLGCIDAETDPFEHGNVPEPFSWGIILENNGNLIYRYFWQKTYLSNGDTEQTDPTQELLDYLISINWRGIIYAHNGGKFDFHYILEYMFLWDEIPVINMINGRIAFLKWKGIEFRDSYLILPVPLKATGDKDFFDYKLMREDLRHEHKKLILKYLKQDVLGLYRNVSGFVEEFGLGLTIANRSFNEMKKDGIKPLFCTVSHDELFRQFFFGGRCQAFKFGSFYGDFSYLDINSAYPFAMLHNHWYGMSHIVHDNLKSVETGKLKYCFIELSCLSEGAFPVRTVEGIRFPKEKGLFKVTGWEFETAKSLGLLSKIRIRKIYEPKRVRDFKPFIERFYERKLNAEKDGDTQQRLFAKLMMNAGYGRFAMNPDKWADNELTHIGEHPKVTDKQENPWEMICRFWSAGFDVHEKKVNESRKRFYNVAVAASVTGFVRAMMMRAVETVDEIFYCDTDSMIFKGNHSVEIGDKLGQWSIEAKGTELHIGGKKLYTLKTIDNDFKNASKGCNLGQDPDGTFKSEKERAYAMREKSHKIIKKIAKGESYHHKNNAYNFSMKGKSRFVERTIKITA